MLTDAPTAPAWDALHTADLADEVKTAWNQSKRSLDDSATELLRIICDVADGEELDDDAVSLAARHVAAIRDLPWLI